jgi:protein gp37
MADKSHIEWTDATWNPVTGCTVVSPGCTNCYAMKLAGTRLKHHWSRIGLTTDTKSGPVWNGTVRFNENWLDQPLRWKKPRMIFVCAHGDLFHPDVPDSWIDQVFAVMALCPHHTFQVLTKRPERMRDYLTTCPPALRRRAWSKAAIEISATQSSGWGDPASVATRAMGDAWPLPNVWLGTSVEDQRRADERIPHLLATPAAVRFLSAEPLLGPVDLQPFLERCHAARDGECMADSCPQLRDGEPHRSGRHCPLDDWGDGEERPVRLDWVIVGGESGDGARPMHPDWARALRDQCTAAGVPFFFKQWGNWLPFGQSGFHHWSAHNVARNGQGDRPWLGHAHFNDGQRGPETHSIGPVLTMNIGYMLQCVSLGKKAAGRLLDGVEQNGMPGPDRHD